MSTNIESITAVAVTDAQAKAIRKLALNSSKKTGTELAADLFAQVVRGRFKAKAETIGKEAGERYDMIVASGLLNADTLKMLEDRKSFIAKAKAEYADILSDL